MEKAWRFLRKYEAVFTYLTVFAAIFGRYIYCGFTYWPQLDDYIQYHNYGTSGDSIGLVLEQGLLASRPLAGIADVYIWARMFDGMIIGVLILSLLYAGAAVLFRSLFGRYFGTGWFFAAVFALLPLGMEGAYWMSAATRIIPGVFFTALALYLFQKFCDRPKWYGFLLWAIVQLISYGFYEQMLVLSFTLTMLVMLLNLLAKRTCAWFGLWACANAGIYFAFTSAFSAGGMLSSRMEIILPVTPYYFEVFLPEITRQVGAAFLKGGFLTLCKGFLRGAGMIFGDGAWLYMLFLLALTAAVFFGLRKRPEPERQCPAWTVWIFGFLIALAPVTPFFIIGNPWFSLRGTVASFAGIALLADALLRLLCRNRRTTAAAVTAGFACICCISSVSEISDYRATYAYDQTVSTRLAETLVGQTTLGRVGVLNLNPSYLEDQNYYYHEHIHGVTESNWALYGAVVCAAYDSGEEIVSDIVPLATDGFAFYVGWNNAIKRIDGFDTLFFWNDHSDTLIPVTYRAVDALKWEIYYEDGSLCATVWEEEGDDKYGYVRLEAYN